MLSDTGLGELRLGVSLKQAKALGLVGERTEESPDETCEQYTGAKGSGVHYLYFTDDQLIIIDVTQAAKLDTGLAIGSTYTQLHNAYGDQIGNDTGPGRIYVTAPGAPVKAEYRVALDSDTAFPDSKITEITLQTVDSGCYE
ncbi:hypothetical protein [Kineosporia succinea]|uniref:Uncharacterized protein n=1 Tax=Kineosporia succinea TaxID=84632 RepID=A0ABT9PF00_9ACTN|nr:hypothetical protein [Kineosporia succinea]MDP9831283.1 hypothetical protein [Kineosporia succinea]